MRRSARRAVWLAGGLLLLALPLLVESRSWLLLLTQIFLFAVYAMSYDLLLGYTGIVSFGHALFFGLGAYAAGIVMQRIEASLGALLLALVLSAVLCAAVSYAVGALTLRLKSHFFAMFTLALSGLFLVVAEKWRSLTMGNDGFAFSVPEWLRGREAMYWLSLGFLAAMYALLRRIVASPFGTVLVAIRENEARAAALGYQVHHYKVLSCVIAGVIAGWSGAFHALALRFVNTSVFSVDVTLDALLMTIVGGAGTLIGPILGAALIELAHHGLADLANTHWIFERWIIFFGLVYILAVRFFPQGIVGTVQRWGRARSLRGMPPQPVSKGVGRAVETVGDERSVGNG